MVYMHNTFYEDANNIEITTDININVFEYPLDHRKIRHVYSYRFKYQNVVVIKNNRKDKICNEKFIFQSKFCK